MKQTDIKKHPISSQCKDFWMSRPKHRQSVRIEYIFFQVNEYCEASQLRIYKLRQQTKNAVSGKTGIRS